MKLITLKPVSLGTIGLALVLSLSNLQAITILSDDFSGSGLLAGSLTDTGQSWSGSNWQRSGGVLDVSSSSAGTGISGLTFVPNNQYNLSVDLNITAGGNNWLAFGFGDFASNRQLWMHRRQNNEIELFATGSSSNFFQAVPNSDSFPLNLEIQLDTGSTLANSTARWFANGNDLGASASVDMTGIDSIFLGNISTARGSFDNLALTADFIPEPSTTLLGAGSLLLLMKRKRS